LTALLQRKQHSEALALLERYREQFPRDPEYALHTQARLLEAQGNLDGALEVYSRNYQPRWSDSLVQGYLGLLRRAGRFESFVQALGQKLKQNPLDFPSVTLLFRGTLSQGNLEAARNALFHFRTEKENRNQPFADDELETLAHYFDALNHFNEAARYFLTLALQTRDNAEEGRKPLPALRGDDGGAEPPDATGRRQSGLFSECGHRGHQPRPAERDAVATAEPHCPARPG
jgi:tetratricopeptide (TPR) repeat protein